MIGLSAAEWVRSVRHASGLSIRDFAKKIGKHFVTVTGWEGGDSEPGWDSIQAILGVYPGGLQSKDSVTVKSAEARELAAVVDAQDATKRRYIVTLVKNVLGIAERKAR